MSWFTDIAGKAETFLNKIDQNAAVALNTSTPKSERDKSRPRKTEPFLEPNEENRSFKSNDNSSSYPTSADQSYSSETKHLNGASSTPSSSSLSNVNTTSSSSSSNARNNDSKRSNSKRQQSSSNKPGLSNKGSTPTTLLQINDNSTNEKVKGHHKNVNSSISSSSTTTTNANKEEELIAYLNSGNPSELNESSLLQDEVESQARELKLLNSNHRSLQKDHEELKKKLQIYKDKLAKSESSRETNEAEEEDLRKLLEERENEIRSLTSRHEQALEALQKLELSQENVQKLEQCVLENSQLKSENENLLQRTEMLSSQAETAENHVLSMKSTLASMEKEFSNYKDKAKSILSYKDELISSLKNEDGSSPHIDFTSNTAEELFAEVTALKNERELLQADLSQTRAVAESLKEDNTRLEKEIGTLRYYSEDLNGQLKKEKEVVGNLQNENLQVCQQISSLQFELEREKNDKRKNEELVTQYKKDLQSLSSSQSTDFGNGSRINQNGSVNGSNGTDKEVQKLKTRVNALSQSLFEKQSLINDISTDKQLLQIEVERLQNELRTYRTENNEYSHNSGLPQTVIASQPLYLSESPWDSRVSAKMKRIYTQLDAVFCQFGLALRKRPNLRFGMSLYVIFLHLWVFFVLFSWMHHAAPDPGEV